MTLSAETLRHVESSKGRVYRGRKWKVMKNKDWIWRRNDENRKRKYNMTQKEMSAEETGVGIM